MDAEDKHFKCGKYIGVS